MKFTTHLELQSQTTRLDEHTSYAAKLWVKDGILTLYDASFQRTYTQVSADSTSLGYNSMTRLGRSIFKLSSSRFTRRY